MRKEYKLQGKRTTKRKWQIAKFEELIQREVGKVTMLHGKINGLMFGIKMYQAVLDDLRAKETK